MGPQPVSVIDNAVSVHLGGSSSCAITSDGSLYCWGSNHYGQLGVGHTTNLPTPTLVTGLSLGVVDLSGGYWHKCAVKVDRSVWCWGSGFSGALGTGGNQMTSSPVETLF